MSQENLEIVRAALDASIRGPTTHFVGCDGIGVQARVTLTFTIRDGMIVRTCLFQDKQDALEAMVFAE